MEDHNIYQALHHLSVENANVTLLLLFSYKLGIIIIIIRLHCSTMHVDAVYSY